MRVKSKLLLLAIAFLTVGAIAQPQPVQLFDGRQAISGRGSALPAAETTLVKNEVRRQKNHPVLKQRLGGLNPNFEEFDVRDWADGSFTRKGAKQRAYLYRYSYTNGVVVTENSKVVAHYSGDPGDYALFIAARKTSDLNGDGRNDLVLLRNTEDTADIIAYVFSLDKTKANYLGATLVFTSNVRPGEDPVPNEEMEDTAYKASATGAQLSRQKFVKRGEGGWRAQGTTEAFKLEGGAQVVLSRLDTASSK